jgi:hypothetical protein
MDKGVQYIFCPKQWVMKIDIQHFLTVSYMLSANIVKRQKANVCTNFILATIRMIFEVLHKPKALSI